MSPQLPQALPGFEQTLVPADMADIGADLTHKRYTGERLRKCYPGKYALAVRAYFDCRRSVESICDILKIDKETMAAVVEQESIARGVFEHERRIRARAASVKEKMLDKLNELLDDPEAIERAGVFGLTKAIQALSSQQVQTDPAEDKKGAREAEFDVPNEYEEIVDAVIIQPADNGFGQEKRPARENESGIETRAPTVASEDVRQDGVNHPPTSCSALPDVLGADGSGTVQTGADSVRQYRETPKNKGFRNGVANSVDNPCAEKSGRPTPPTPPAIPAEPPAGETAEPPKPTGAGRRSPQEGGGWGGPPKRPGETKIHSRITKGG